MLSESERQIKELIETKVSGANKEEALLFHISVERKLEAVKMWLQNVETIWPDFTTLIGTSSVHLGEKLESKDDSIEPTIIKISAYIDSFFMSGKSVLDALAHEIRSLYGFGGHTGKLCFDYFLILLNKYHQGSNLDLYLTPLNILHSDWYKDLNHYRRISTHESIIPIKSSGDFDLQNGEWKNFICKLPDGKNFMSTGRQINDNLYRLITESYNKILNDIKHKKTKISL